MRCGISCAQAPREGHEGGRVNAHPVASIFPPMSEGEYAALKADIGAQPIGEIDYKRARELMDLSTRSYDYGGIEQKQLFGPAHG